MSGARSASGPYGMRNAIISGLVALALFLSLASSTAATLLEDATAAYKRGDEATALKLFRPLAERGNSEAEFHLGVMYQHGMGGLPIDYGEAVTWFRKAAEQGNAHAQFSLGGMYADGLGVPRDYAQAVNWFSKAGDHGDVTTQVNLGVMFREGHDVPVDHAEAARWLRRAAERGDGHAQFYLGYAYAAGEGIPQDYTEAVKWYRKAAAQGMAIALFNLGFMYDKGWGVPQDCVQAYKWVSLAVPRFNDSNGYDAAVSKRDELANKMTPAQIAEANKLAGEWQPSKPQALQTTRGKAPRVRSNPVPLSPK